MRKKKGKKPARAESADELKVYISPVMAVMAVFFVATGMAYEFACSLAAVMLHECAHARVAKKLGYELNVINLMPYGAALCGDVQIKSAHEVRIAVAGPLFNLVLAVLFAALWWLAPATYLFTRAFCVCNLYIGLFNLLPVYPLDGGRVALALLSLKLKRAKAYRIMRIVSAIAGIAALVLFALSAAVGPVNLCLLSVGAFMTASAFLPDRKAQYTALFSLANRAKRTAVPLEIRRFAVSGDAELAAACRALDPDRYSEFVILDRDLNPVKTISESQLIADVKQKGYSAKLGKF